MKKLLIPMVILLASIFIIVGCSSNPATPTTPVATTPSISTPPVTTPATPTSTTPTAAPTISTSPTVQPSASPTISATPTGGQQYGGTLRIMFYSGPLTLGDPTLLTDSSSIQAIIPCIQTLVETDNSGVFHGVLATDWTVAPDNLSITFHLRQGVKFQDGTDFNAAAAKWNLDRYYSVFQKSSPTSLWNGVDVLDNYTIRLNLKSFQNTILGGLDGSAGMMVSPTAAQKNGFDWLKMNPVGTGPYQFQSFSRDVSLDYVRFNNYWGGKPYLDGINFIYVSDPTTAELAFQSGVADVVSTSTDAVTADLINKGYKLEKRPGPMMNLIPDSKNASSPFSDINVRQAISYAIDRQGLANSLGYGLWEVVNQPAAAYQFAHINDSPYTYDLAKAKQLMKASAYPNGFKTTIITSSTFSKDPLVAIQSELAAIGINVSINVVEFSAWNDYVNKGWNNALLWATQGATFTNYVSFLQLYYATNTTRYPVLAKPAGLQDLITQAAATSDYATEVSLCQKAVELLVSDCTAIPVYIQPASYILNNNVHDTHFDSLAGSGFRWSAETAWLSK